MYKKVAPILNPRTTIKVPNHFPKINPPSKATGDPNPKNGNTHNIVNNKKIIDIKKKFEFFISRVTSWRRTKSTLINKKLLMKK